MELTIFRRLATCVVVLFTVLSVQAQSLVQQGSEAFLKNDRKLAFSKLNEALKIPEQKKQALLWLSMLCENDESFGKASFYFRQFCKEETNIAPYVFAMWSNQQINESFNRKSAEELDFLQSLLTRQAIDGSLKAMAYSLIGKHYENRRKISEADNNYSKIGAIANWMITGEFENISGSGFDKQYDPITHPEANAVFKNKYGAKVGWFVPPYWRKDKWVDFDYYFNYQNSVIYAQTFVQSAKEQEVQLRAGVSGSLKIWLNDQVVFAEPEERNNDLDTYIRKVKLHQGYNRILVQVGESYAGRSNFLIRLTDDSGNPVTGLSNTASTQNYVKETAYKVEPVTLFVEDFLQQQLKQDPASVLHNILLAKTYMRSDKVYETRHTLELVKDKFPASTYINSMMVELFSKSDNRTGMESTQESIKMNDPGHPLSLNMFYSNSIEKEDYKKAEEYLNKLAAIFGEENQEIQMKRISMAGYNKNQAEVVQRVEAGYKKFPDSRDFVNLKYLVEKEIKKNNKSAMEVLKKYLANNSDYTLAGNVARIYFDAGDAENGIKVFQKEIDEDPVGVGIYSKISDIYLQMQNYNKAESYMKDALKIAPYIPSYHSSLAKIYKEAGKKAEAVQEYTRALELHPSGYTSIQELRKLEGKKEVYDYFHDENVSELVSNAPSAKDYPDDNVLILNESTQSVVYPSGASEERHVMLAKILNSTGLENWKQYTAPVKSWQNYIIEDAEVIKANGSKVPAEKNENEIVFTNLEVGDCIHVKYKLYNYSQGQLANKFWDTFYFSHGYPYLKSSYSLLIAKNQPLLYKFSEKAIEPKKTSVEDFDLYEWNSEKQASLSYEDKMPPLDDVANILHITTIPDWKSVSNWYNDIASAKARPNYEVKQAVKSLFNDKKNLTETQKAERIYNYITRNITYSSVSFRQSGLVPQNPATVLNTKIGDCKDVSTLFLSMAKEAGLNAKLVLVNTKDSGVKSLMLPSINFNHCIVEVETEGKERYLELTSNYLPFSSFGRSSLNSVILDIDGKTEEKGIKYLNPANRKNNCVWRKKELSFDNSNLVVKETNYRVAALAGYHRETYLDLSEKDRVKKMQESIKSDFAAAELTSVKFRNLENSDSRDTLFTELNYTIKDDIKTIGGITIVTLPWSDKALNTDYTVNLPRNFAFDISQMYGIDSESEVISLQIPATKNLIENIPPVKLSNEFIEYTLDVKVAGKNLIYSRQFKLKKDEVPAEKVEAFNEFYKKIIAADSKQIAFK